jgi:hypothetical protein
VGLRLASHKGTEEEKVSGARGQVSGFGLGCGSAFWISPQRHRGHGGRRILSRKDAKTQREGLRFRVWEITMKDMKDMKDMKGMKDMKDMKDMKGMKYEPFIHRWPQMAADGLGCGCEISPQRHGGDRGLRRDVVTLVTQREPSSAGER